MPGAYLWGWDSANSVWVKILVNADGKLIIDPSEIFENPPTDGETAKGAQSDWCYDHNADPDAHHARQHSVVSAPDHTGRMTKAWFEWTANKLLLGAGAGADPTEIDVPTGGYTEGARVYHDADQSIPGVTPTTLAFNSERYDTDAIHDPATNNSRLTCKTAGKYVISFSGKWGNFTADLLNYFKIVLNGTTTIAQFYDRPGRTVMRTLSTTWDLAVDDYIELIVYQVDSIAWDIQAFSSFTPEFMMQRIG